MSSLHCRLAARDARPGAPAVVCGPAPGTPELTPAGTNPG